MTDLLPFSISLGQPRHAVQMARASLLSVIPFLLVGGLTHYGLTLSLGGSWAVSLGLITFMVGGCTSWVARVVRLQASW
jgi:hypothetical protein